MTRDVGLAKVVFEFDQRLWSRQLAPESKDPSLPLPFEECFSIKQNVCVTIHQNAVLGATANGKSKQSMGAKFKRKAANKEKLSRESSNTSSTSSSSGDSASCIVKTENVNIQVSPAQVGIGFCF